MDMKMKIKIFKECFKFEDGNLCQGIRFMLAPKCSKFISINKETEMLLEAMNPDVYQWYKNSPIGADATLVETLPETKGDISK